MNEYEELYQNALLADASYINFDDFTDLSGNVIESSPDLAREFAKRGFSDQQRTAFLAQYDISFPQPNTYSGFSATVFTDRINGGKLTVSFRGTEPLNLEAPISSWTAFWADMKQDALIALGSSVNDPDSQHHDIGPFFQRAGIARPEYVRRHVR